MYGVTLKKRWEFERVYRHGRKVWNHAYVVYVLFRSDETMATSPGWRYGTTVTKKFGNAVRRNRAKRLIRESLRSVAARIRPDVDIVVVARRPADGLKSPEAQERIVRLLCRAKALTASARAGAHESRPEGRVSDALHPAAVRRSPKKEAPIR